MVCPQRPERSDALRDLKVLDQPRVLGAPYCTQILSDYGADVIKVEPPTGDETRTWRPPFVEGTASYFIGVNRNKRGLALDLSSAEGREIVLRVLAGADVLGIGNDGQFRKFCEFVGAPGLAADPRYASNGERHRNRDSLCASIEALLADREAATLCQALLKAGVPAGLIHSLSEVLKHPHTEHRRMLVEIGAGQRGLGVPVKLSGTPRQAHTPAPAIGQHNYEVLETDALVEAGVAVRAAGAHPGERS